MTTVRGRLVTYGELLTGTRTGTFLTHQDLKSFQIAHEAFHRMAPVPPDRTSAAGNSMERCTAMHRALVAHRISENFKRSRQALEGCPSQEVFGTLINRSRTWVNKAESGRNLATPETIALWAEATGHDLLWFYEAHTETELGAVA